MDSQVQIRLLGITGLIGVLLFGLFSLLHPLTFNPWDTYGAFDKVSSHSFWVLDHIFILIGITFWLLGISAGQGMIEKDGLFKKVGAWLFILSLTIWIVLLTLEIGVVPLLVEAVEQHQNELLMTIWFVVFCFGLLAGYFAFIFIWLGIFLYSLAMKGGNFPGWFRQWGIWSGLIGILGIAAGLIQIDYIAPILVLTSVPPFIWTVIFLGFMVKFSSAKESSG